MATPQRVAIVKAPARFVERERVGSIRAVHDMLLTAREVYGSALRHDGLPADTRFAVFSDDNPFVPFYERAMGQYQEMAQACAAHGYVGLSLQHRGVYGERRIAPTAAGRPRWTGLRYRRERAEAEVES